MKLKTFFIPSTSRILRKLFIVSEGSIKIQISHTVGTFPSYLQTKNFILEPDCAISSKLKMLLNF